MKILLTGSTGQLGRELTRTLQPIGNVIALSRDDMDLSRPQTAGSVIESHAPDMIVNAAAYTAVDRAESERDAAQAINGDSVGVMAHYCADRKIPLVHFSTDYVFSGAANAPYREDDALDPVNAYGATKLAGENAIRHSQCAHYIFRTAWVYGNHGANFLRSMLRLARERDRLTIVADQHGAPAWSRMLAELTAAAILRDPERSRTGTYHLSASGQTTWHGFATALLKQAYDLKLIPRNPEVARITTAEFPTPAKRPAYSVLDNARFESVFGLRVPTWQEQLGLCLQDFHTP